jgi:hypothetical protein
MNRRGLLRMLLGMAAAPAVPVSKVAAPAKGRMGAIPPYFPYGALAPQMYWMQPNGLIELWPRPALPNSVVRLQEFHNRAMSSTLELLQPFPFGSGKKRVWGKEPQGSVSQRYGIEVKSRV